MSLGVLACLTGCQPSHPVDRAFAAPAPSSVRVTYFVGSPLSGPTLEKPRPFLPSDPLSVRVQFVALELFPAVSGQPLAARTRMIVQTRRFAPVLPAEQLLRGCRWIDLPEGKTLAELILPAAGRIVSIAEPVGALPPTVTASFMLTDATGLDDAGSSAAAYRSVEIDAYRPASGPLQIGVALQDLADQAPDKTDLGTESKSSDSKKTPPKSAGERNSAGGARHNGTPTTFPSTPPVFQRELAIIELPPLSAQPAKLAILIPIHFSNTDARAIAAVVTIAPATNSPEHLAAASRCAADLQKSSDAIANDPQTLTVVSPEWSIYRTALDALTDPNRRRSALVYLATQTHAPLSRDVALTADVATLDRLSGEVRRAIAKPGGNATPGSNELGWTLDRTTFQMLGAMFNEMKLPPELMGVLTSFAGQVGRDAGSVDEVSHSLGSRQQFMARLQAENLISLEDSSLAARVRAYDWLRARDQSPPGYDPQAPRKDRRDALEHFVAAATTAPTGSAK